MGRWKAGARERLIEAAVQLFAEQGFAATTVPQITERAGLTTRTFYRHFADKAEVLFGSEQAATPLREVMADAPPGLSSSEFLTWGLARIARERFDGHRDQLRALYALIAADETLRERSLAKRVMLTGQIVDVLRERGLTEQRARLLAEAISSAINLALEQWLQTDTTSNVDVLALNALQALKSELDELQPPPDQ